MPQMTNKIDGYNFQHDSRVTPNLCFHFDVPKYLSQLPFPKKTHIFLCIPKIIPKKITLFQVLAFFFASKKSPLKNPPPSTNAPLENLILHLWMPNLHGPKHHEDRYPYYEHDPRDLKRCYVGHHLRFQPASSATKHPNKNGLGSGSFGKCVDQACRKW